MQMFLWMETFTMMSSVAISNLSFRRVFVLSNLCSQHQVTSPTRSQAVARIADRTAAPSGVTWRHRSRDYLIAHMPFPIGGSLEPSLYLFRFPRYSTSNVTQWLTRPWYDP